METSNPNMTTEPDAFDVPWYAASYGCSCGAVVDVGGRRGSSQYLGLTFPRCESCGRRGVVVMSPHASSLLWAIHMVTWISSGECAPGDVMDASHALQAVKNRVWALDGRNPSDPSSSDPQPVVRLDPMSVFRGAAALIRNKVIESLKMAVAEPSTAWEAVIEALRVDLNAFQAVAGEPPPIQSRAD